MVFVAVFEVCHAELIELPGANRSTQVPIFEKLERESLLVVDPTVMAAGTRDGEVLQALALLLPAATTIVTPALMAAFTAVSMAVDAPPPKDILATAGRCV